jgi:hypothetical protein
MYLVHNSWYRKLGAFRDLAPIPPCYRYNPYYYRTFKCGPACTSKYYILLFRCHTGINFSNLRTVDCSPNRSKSKRNGFVGALHERRAIDFLGRSVTKLQMHRSRRSLKDLEREQDAPSGRPNASLNFVPVYLLAILTVYPELTPGKQDVTFWSKSTKF